MTQNNEEVVKEEIKTENVKEDRKVQAENMRLKKYIKQLEEEILTLKKFMGVE